MHEESPVSSPSPLVAAAREAVFTLLAKREKDATICPSEVARYLSVSGQESATGNWREMMPIVHEATDDLLRSGKIRLSWKGIPMTERAGPYRIGRSPA